MGKEVFDTFFLIHGAPLVLIDDTLPARTFLKSWREKILPEKPKYVLVISGHWETNEPSINVVDRHETIHDFEDFPPEMYEVPPVPSSGISRTGHQGERRPSGRRVQASPRGHKARPRPRSLGPTHANVPRSRRAGVPALHPVPRERNLSVYHFNLGKALAPLREQGVLIIGTGSVTHNMESLIINNVGGTVADWALEFDDYVKDALLNGRYDEVNQALEKHPHAKMAHPDGPVHFYPLLAAIGAAGGEKAKAELIHHSFSRHTISYANYRFKSAE
ncbi:putative stizolobate synthase [Rosa chinensis]|uniref:Putative stizolobate synthase n=1 Tax=Rosa chinensis TaxID=74649 RepID=A0A2P6RWK0_ROSCH|nr:putative stizolobate synthase [Rosa chinensis]